MILTPIPSNNFSLKFFFSTEFRIFITITGMDQLQTWKEEKNRLLSVGIILTACPSTYSFFPLQSNDNNFRLGVCSFSHFIATSSIQKKEKNNRFYEPKAEKMKWRRRKKAKIIKNLKAVANWFLKRHSFFLKGTNIVRLLNTKMRTYATQVMILYMNWILKIVFLQIFVLNFRQQNTAAHRQNFKCRHFAKQCLKRRMKIHLASDSIRIRMKRWNNI